jgi:hypothetical protein
MFDDEIVCLGNSITASTGAGFDEYDANTTLNQCNLHGDVTVSENGTDVTSLISGEHPYTTAPKWVLHDSIGYVFPAGGNLVISNRTQNGNWYDINNNGTNATVSRDVFSLWFNHGKQATGEAYAYIIVPAKSVAGMQDYHADGNIEILANTDSLQAVYHKQLKIYGLVFFKPATFVGKELTITAGAGCVLLVKDADKANVKLHISDPQRQASPVKLGVKTPLLSEMKAVTYANPVSPYQGLSLEFTVNEASPEYTDQGRDVLLDRSDWTIVTSYAGAADATVGGNKPENIIDGNNVTAFAFVKPGKTYSEITVAADDEASFTIDLKDTCDMTYLLYRHRDAGGNSSSYIRASQGSFYGRNAETDAWEPITEHFAIPTDVTEARIDFPQKVSYRYVKFVLEAWDTVNGSTMQVSEFNLGNTIFLDIPSGLEQTLQAAASQVSVYPNPVPAGQTFRITTDGKLSGATIAIYTLAGVKVIETKAVGNVAETIINQKGLYVVDVKKNAERRVLKVVVN